jgi:hypothetical protein
MNDAFVRHPRARFGEQTNNLRRVDAHADFPENLERRLVDAPAPLVVQNAHFTLTVTCFLSSFPCSLTAVTVKVVVLSTVAEKHRLLGSSSRTGGSTRTETAFSTA